MERGKGVVVTPRLIIGLCIALFGLLLTLDRINLIEAGRVLRFWPLVLMVIGTQMIAQSRRTGSGSGTNGLIVLIIGGWFLLNSLEITRVRIWDLFWPLVLMAIGTALVMQTLRRGTGMSSSGSDDALAVFAVMSGVNRVASAIRFRGGEFTAFMGGGQVDLRQAVIPEGEEAVIDVLAVMGSCELVVPPSWTVAAPLVTIMGGVEDKRLPPLPTTTVAPAAIPPRLVLRGFVLMGGVQIRS